MVNLYIKGFVNILVIKNENEVTILCPTFMQFLSTKDDILT
jgi:hypothetical protein